MKNIIHWCMPKRMWTSHTYKSCAKAPVILVMNNWETETKPKKSSNPKGWIVTDHTNVIINPDDEILSRFTKKERLIYDKNSVQFNIDKGEYLLFNREGCFVLNKKLGECI